MPDREPVNLFHVPGGHETIGSPRRSHFRSRRSPPEMKTRYHATSTKQRGSVMWALIIGLVYRRFCKGYLTGMRYIATAG